MTQQRDPSKTALENFRQTMRGTARKPRFWAEALRGLYDLQAHTNCSGWRGRLGPTGAWQAQSTGECAEETSITESQALYTGPPGLIAAFP